MFKIIKGEPIIETPSIGSLIYASDGALTKDNIGILEEYNGAWTYQVKEVKFDYFSSLRSSNHAVIGYKNIKYSLKVYGLTHTHKPIVLGSPNSSDNRILAKLKQIDDPLTVTEISTLITK